MSALYLTSDANDLEFSGGHLRFTTTPVEVAVQKARVRFAFWLGEWFLDVSEGFPYLTQVLKKGPNLPLIESLARRTLLSIPEIDAVLSVRAVHDRAARSLALSWSVQVGEAVVSSDQYGAFVLGSV